MVVVGVLFLDNARVYRFDHVGRRFARHRSLLIDAGRVVALDEDPSGLGAQRRDMDGATLVPAFIDAHVHLAQAGFVAGARSLAGVRSYDEFARAVAEAVPDGDVLYLGQYDDARWNDGAIADAVPLER